MARERINKNSQAFKGKFNELKGYILAFEERQKEMHKEMEEYFTNGKKNIGPL